MSAEPEDFRAIFEDVGAATEPSEDEGTWTTPLDGRDGNGHPEDRTGYLTRARHNLQDVDLEDLEKLLREDESDLELAQGEYQKFLAALQGMEDLDDGYNEEEDADFVVSVDDLLQDGDDDQLTRNIIRKANLRPEHALATGQRTEPTRRKRKRKDGRTGMEDTQARPIDSVQRLAKKRLPPLRLKPLVPPLAHGMVPAPHIAANGSTNTVRITAPHPAFSQEQLDVLHAQFRTHTQLVVQTYAISESCTCGDHKSTAQQIRQQAKDLVDFCRAQVDKMPPDTQVRIRLPLDGDAQEQEEVQLRTVCQAPALEWLPDYLEEVLHYAPPQNNLVQHCQIAYPEICESINACMDRFAPFFDEEVRVAYPSRREGTKPLFTSGEDLLLAKGIDRFGMNWEMIQQIFLPTKTARQVFIRQKNRSASRSPPNEIKAAKCRRLTPLTDKELKLVHSLLERYGQKWEVIQTFLPHRDTQYLPMLWREASQGQTFKRPGSEEHASQLSNGTPRNALIRATLLDTSERGAAGQRWTSGDVQSHRGTSGSVHVHDSPVAAGSMEMHPEVPASLQEAMTLSPAAPVGMGLPRAEHGSLDANPRVPRPFPQAVPSHPSWTTSAHIVPAAPPCTVAGTDPWHSPTGRVVDVDVRDGDPSMFPPQGPVGDPSSPRGPDAAMVVEGRVTTWTQQDDRRILLDVRRCGESTSTFQHLAAAVGWDARAVEARYHWLCRRLALSSGPRRHRP